MRKIKNDNLLMLVMMSDIFRKEILRSFLSFIMQELPPSYNHLNHKNLHKWNNKLYSVSEISDQSCLRTFDSHTLVIVFRVSEVIAEPRAAGGLPDCYNLHSFCASCSRQLWTGSISLYQGSSWTNIDTMIHQNTGYKKCNKQHKHNIAMQNS